MDARLFRRIQRYGWDAATDAYARGWVPLLEGLTRESWSAKGDVRQLRDAYADFHEDVRDVLAAVGRSGARFSPGRGRMRTSTQRPFSFSPKRSNFTFIPLKIWSKWAWYLATSSFGVVP